MSDDLARSNRRERIRENLRTPMINKNFFGIDKDPKFKYRFVEYEVGTTKRSENVDHFESLGYSIVQSDQQVGQKDIRSPTRLGKGAVCKSFGGGSMQVLMRIPVEHYIENQKIKAEIDEENLINSRQLRTKKREVDKHNVNISIEGETLDSDTF